MDVFLEKHTDPVIACVCPHILCRKLHPQTLASADDHDLYQDALYVIKARHFAFVPPFFSSDPLQCPKFDTVVGYYDRDVDQFRSVLASDAHGGNAVGPSRGPRRPPIDCSLGTHRPRRPEPRPHVPRHGILEINLTVIDEKVTNTTTVVVPGDIFHLALLDREQFQQLAFSTIDPQSLLYYDFARLNWYPLTHQTAIHLAPTTRRVLLRAPSRLKPFPPRFVCDFSDRYDDYCALIASETARAVAFKKAFPEYRYDPTAFEAALELWGETSHDVQVGFKDAGRTDTGLWADLVKDGNRRKLAAAAQRRRSGLKHQIVIEIDDD
ncbi:hypothetical protein AURDEDRAFT_177016 [Auricularia subglabra TFB-10046 SS5]|uniref:Uncharacterized protein n=1 Tax=Auricularia subglabra (strain TFB-10046 / SS5) TaxID=717982 RepID=J0CUA3_AURST|nr:hypothetical protein AURDEDRAFT_177016 [Auricularia subglabra TFB-10046 SS5]